jgi:alkyldihydroxyacetonephosphate synthase
MPPTGPPRDPELSWSGWGDPASATALPEAIQQLLASGLAVRRATPVPASIYDLELTPIRLADAAANALAAVVGGDHAHADHETRARHALGKSTPDLLAVRSGEPIPAPDLVLVPGSHEEVLAVLGECSRRHVAVVPFGGGTSVVGGLVPESSGFTGWVALDVRRLDQLVALDEESRLGHPGPGPAGPSRRGAALAAGLHDRPLSPVLRVRDAGWLRGDALERAVVSRLRPLR